MTLPKEIHLTTFFNVPIKIHRTWYIFVITLFLAQIVTSGLFSGICLVGWISIAHFFVTIHEYGHILIARRFNIHAHKILLTPIGGVACFDGSMYHMSPKEEAIMAFCGPLTNFIWVGIFYLIACIFNVPFSITSFASLPNVLSTLAMLNLFIGCFNLIPAFPMDGGRIYRSILTNYMSKYQATKIFLYLGPISIGILILIFKDYIILFIIMIFTIMATKQELKILR